MKKIVMSLLFFTLFLLPTHFNQLFALGRAGHIGGSSGLGVGEGGYEAGGYHPEKYWRGGSTGWDPHYAVRDNYSDNGWRYYTPMYTGGPYPRYYYSYPGYYVYPYSYSAYYNSPYDYTLTGNREGTYYYTR